MRLNRRGGAAKTHRLAAATEDEDAWLRWVGPLLFACAMATALAYGWSRLTHAASAGGTAPAAGPILVLAYPDEEAVKGMALDYRVFDRIDHTAAAALPLPPGSALQTVIRINAARLAQLEVALPDRRCGDDVLALFYRPDQMAPVQALTLASGAAAQDVDLRKANRDTLIMTLQMVPHAKNNWYCSVSLKGRPA